MNTKIVLIFDEKQNLWWVIQWFNKFWLIVIIKLCFLKVIKIEHLIQKNSKIV
jgi:hypothetical protein